MGVVPNGLNAGLGTDWLRSRFAFVADFDLGMRARAPVAVADLAGDIGGGCGCAWACGGGVFLGMRLPPWVDSSTPLS